MLYPTLVVVFVVAALAAPPPPSTSGSVVEETWRETGNNTTDELGRQCSCSGSTCQCCVDFNMTYADLGGPGCVKMKYVSKDEGIFVNVSYGESQLHGGQIKASGPSITCMNLLSEWAQMCAKFTDVAVTEEGMTACTALEPTLLGYAQEGIHLGCFVMGPQGMAMINKTSESQEETTGAKPGESEEDLIAAVNETAEEGIAWFSSLLAFNFGKQSADNSTETTTRKEESVKA